ncbi:hypothetical protein EV2_006780 [Malus domestica]
MLYYDYRRTFEYRSNSDGKPQDLHLKPYKGTYLDSFCSSGSALPDKPAGEQKPDRKHQPAPTSRGAVCLSARKQPQRKF